MAQESGKGGKLIPLLFLLMLLGGAGGYNYHRNAQAEDAEFRPFGSYADADLDALAAAYEEQLSGGMAQYQKASSKAVTVREGGLLGEQVREFERVQKISGHMLRQGMMGSDLSYEDMMEFSDWRQAYTATVQGEVPCGSSTCWSLELLARDDTIAYPRRVVSVDQQTGLPVMQELYALSGMLLKTWTMEDPVAHGERWYPQRMVIVEVPD